MKRSDSIHVASTGTTVTSGAASASVAIPNASDGVKPRYVRIAASGESFVKMGVGAGTTATNNDVLIQPADCVIMSVGGNTHIAYIQGPAAARVNITPLEDL